MAYFMNPLHGDCYAGACTWMYISRLKFKLQRLTWIAGCVKLKFLV